MRLVRRPEEGPRRDDELDAMLAAARVAVEHAELDVALQAIVEAAIASVGADAGSVQLLDTSSMTLTIAAEHGLPPEARRERLTLGQGISGTVAVTGQALLLPNAIDVGRFAGHIPKERPIRAAICVPLRARGAILGVLSVSTSRAGTTFDGRDLRLVSLLAEHASLAIATARVIEGTQRRALELELLRGAVTRVGASLDPVEVARVVSRELCTLLDGANAFLLLLGAGARPELLHAHAFTPAHLEAVIGSRSLRLAVPPEVRVVDDVGSDPVFSPLAADLREPRLALVPLHLGDAVGDALAVVEVGPRAHADWVRLLWAFLPHAAGAVANALAHRAALERARELEALIAGTQTALLLVDRDGVIRTISPAAARAFALSPELDTGRPARGLLRGAESILLGRDDDARGSVHLADGRTVECEASTIRAGAFEGARVLRLLDQRS